MNSNNLFGSNQLKASFTYILLASLLLAASLAALPAHAHLPSAETYAPAGSTPTIDGLWSANEWDDAPQYNLSTAGGYFRIKHDDSYVYVIIDLINEPRHGSGCHFVYFDTAHDGGNATELPGDLQLHCCTPPNKFGYGSSPNSATNHRITEFKVSLTDLGSPSLPVEMGFYVKALSENYLVTLYEWPPGAGGQPGGYFWAGTPVPDNWGDIHISEAPPELPVASFTYSPALPLVNTMVTFDGSASYDPDGTIISYAWDFGDGNTGTGMIVNHIYTAYGTYNVTLTVTDNEGLSDAAWAIVTVIKRPVARFTYSPPKPYVNHTVTFNASASTPDGGNITDYTWSFGDGNVITLSIPVINHTYTVAGNYTVTLNVTDTQGLWNTTSKTLTVLSAPPPPYGPTADFTYSPLAPLVNDSVTFDASLSLPGWNGTHVVPVANYTWSFGDGNVTTTANPVITHVYTAVGTYTVNLTVTCEDDPVLIAEGLTWNSTWQNITVLDKTAPRIGGVVQSPIATEVDPDEDVTVTAIDVTDNVGVETVLLMYSTDNVTFTNVTMLLVSGTNNYTGQIPGQAAGTYVTYKIFVNDTSGNPYETSVYAYMVKKAQPAPIPWLWIEVGGAVVIIAIVAIYMVARKRSA